MEEVGLENATLMTSAYVNISSAGDVIIETGNYNSANTGRFFKVTNMYIVRVVVSCLIGLLVLAVNCLIVIAVKLNSNLQTNTNLMMAGICVSDTLSAVPIATWRLLKWIPNDAAFRACHITIWTLLAVSFHVSLYHHVLIAADRFIAVLKPLKYKTWMTRYRVKMLMAVLWVFNIIFSYSVLPHFYLTANALVMRINGGFTGVVIPKDIYFSTMLSQYFTCLVVSVILYLVIFIKIRFGLNKVGPGQTSVSSNQQNRAKQAAMTSGITLAILILTWLPAMLYSFYIKPIYYNLYPWLTYIAEVLLLLFFTNAYINPIVYVTRNKQMRKAVQKIFGITTPLAEETVNTSTAVTAVTET